MNRKFSRCGNNGLNSRTCNEKRLKLFGGRSLGEGDDITRKSKSRGNISFYLNSSNGSKKMAISMVSSTEEHDTRNQAMNGAPLYICRDCSISNSWNTNFSEGAFNSSRNLAMHWWEDSWQILGGRDCLADDTWMACTRDGRLAFLTNVLEPKPPSPNAKY